MIHDYWMLRDDNAFVAKNLPYIRMALDYYEQQLRYDASLSYIRYWFFTDWTFSRGEPPRMSEGLSSIKASGCIPHPKEEICVNYQVDDKGNLKAEISLPEGVEGKFIWKGKETNLRGGKQSLEMK